MKQGVFLAVIVAIACEISAFGATIPRVAGQWPGIPEGPSQELTLGGDTLYSRIDDWIVVYDVVSTSQVRRVGSIGSPFQRIVANERYALQYGSNPLRVFDMADRGAPMEIARISEHVRAAAIVWPYVYVSSDVDELAVYDFTDPAKPTKIDNLPGPGGLTSLVIRGNTLAGVKLAAGTPGSVQLYDISDPGTVTAKGAYGAGIYYQTRLAIEGDLLFVGSERLSIVNIADRANPQKVSEWPQGPVFMHVITDIVSFPGTVWVSVANSGISILDVTNPAAPVEVKRIPGIGFTSHVRRGNELFASDYLDLKLYDVSDPRDPQIKSISSLGGYYSHVTATNNVAIVSAAGVPSRILDVSNPARPSPVAQLPSGYSSVIAGNKLFLQDTNKRINVFDIGNPGAPHLLTVLDLGEFGLSMAVEGHRLFASGSSNIYVINFSNMLDVKLEKTIQMPAWNVRFTRHGNALIATANYVSSYLSVINIDDPANPSIISTITNSGYFGRVGAKGNAVYVERSDAISVFDITDPARLTEVRTLSGSGGYLSVDGDRLFALASDSLSIFDISTPLNPQPLSTLTGLTLNQSSITGAGDVAYIAAGYAGLITVQLAGEPPSAPYLNIADEGEMHRVRWTKDFPEYMLMSVPALGGPWVAGPPGYSPTQMFYEATFSNRRGDRFYGLKK